MYEPLARIAENLLKHPPDVRFEKERFMLFETIDELFGDDSLVYGGESYTRGRRLHLVDNWVKELYEHQMERALDEIERTVVRDGMMAWQCYNMGYIFKTPSVTMGFDVIKGMRSYQREWDVPERLTHRLADCMDVLFVTHRHSDHCDRDIIRRMLKAGKSVFVPEGCRLRFGSYPGLTYAGHHAGYRLLGLQITSYRGRHIYRENPFDLPLVVYEIITGDGKKIFFTGDFDYTAGETFPYKDNIDVLILHCGGISPLYDDQNPYDLGDDDDAFFLGLQKFRTHYVIAGHLSELGHPVGGGRERYKTAFTIFFQLLENLSSKFLVKFWGESFRFPH